MMLWSKLWQLVNRLSSVFAQLMRHPFLTAVGSLIIFLIALRLINQELTKYSIEDLQRAIDDIGFVTVAGAIIAAIASYGALAFNDRYALAMLGKRLTHARTARASLAAYALSNTLGYSWATAATARQRLYRKWGLLPNEIAALSFVTGSAVPIGGLAAAGLGLMITAPEVALHGPLNALFWYGIGLVALVPAALWLVYAKHGPARTGFAAAPLLRPLPPTALAHVSAIVVDWVCAAAVLYILLPNHGGWSFPAFLAVYVLAGMLGSVSGAPGGLGVFEAVILTLAPIGQDTPGAAVALILYRLLYNIVPLGVAILILGLDQAMPAARPAAHAAKRVSSKVGAHVGEAALEFGPRIGAILTFVAGIGMLGSIATPAFTARLDQLAAVGLSSFAEGTHIAAGVVGTMLLFIAPALWKQLRSAWLASVILLALGALIGIAKGLHWEESFLLLTVLSVLFALRDSFFADYVAGKNLLSARWLAAIIGGLVTTIWIANFAYQHLPLRIDTVIDFSRDNDLGRTQRALIGVIVTSFAMVILYLWSKSLNAFSAVDEDGGDTDG